MNKDEGVSRAIERLRPVPQCIHCGHFLVASQSSLESQLRISNHSNRPSTEYAGKLAWALAICDDERINRGGSNKGAAFRKLPFLQSCSSQWRPSPGIYSEDAPLSTIREYARVSFTLKGTLESRCLFLEKAESISR